MGLRLFLALLIAVGLFFGGFIISQFTNSSRAIVQTIDQKKSYYISFDDYYYEVPKQKAVDDRLVAGGQFLYNFGAAIKTNTLDDIFNDGAIAVQALIPLNGDNGAFERYINESVQPSAESAFKGTAEVTFDNRQSDQVRVAEVTAKKDGTVVRRQYIINLPQSVAVISKDDSEAFRSIGASVGQASAKFSDYDKMKLQVLAQSYMLNNRMFDDMYRLAHEDFRGATSVEAINRLADKSKDIFTLQVKVSGVNLTKDEMTATIHYIDSKNPANNKTGTLVFRKNTGEWKLLTLQLPSGTITGATQESPK
ncbi:MAG: hypothetical protein AAB669_00845 [Patescibacteria group bacterium]